MSTPTGTPFCNRNRVSLLSVSVARWSVRISGLRRSLATYVCIRLLNGKGCVGIPLFVQPP